MSVLELPRKLAELLSTPSRYKVAYGGRGSGKSWAFARTLLAMGALKPIKVLCARELQNSIAESVHALLAGQVYELGLQDKYIIKEKEIVGSNGTQFIFAGLRHNITKVKSMEGLDIAWVEEAENVSRVSWETLIPTLRKEGSEIWVSFNPDIADSETYQRFVIQPSPQVRAVEVNHSDNYWFPEVLRTEMEDLKVRDYDEYLTVWEGKCRQFLDGAIYAKELRTASEEGRIGKVPYNPILPVHTFWDLGERDHTSIWFAQFVYGEYRFIDFYQSYGEKISHYLEVLQNRKYLYGKHWLPHDAKQERLQGPSIERIIRLSYPGNVKVLASEPGAVQNGINAARMLFPLCWFDEGKCADGLDALRRYRYDVDRDTKQWSRSPLHDENSDAADAFRYFAMSFQDGKVKKKEKIRDLTRGYEPTNVNWMGS